MLTLKKIIRRYVQIITLILVILILSSIILMEISTERRIASESAARTFSQMEQVLAESQRELTESTDEYRQTCLYNAEAIAYIIQNDLSVLESVAELKKIAEFMEVDEIHIFDETGRIYAGTHPKYYNYTFDSGEQMEFFKPMLEDQSLKLVQEITPNTAEGKLMQYSAIWSGNGEFIVQVGMEPVNVMKATEKNELSYIFSSFRVGAEADYYAVDTKSGEIVGSTNLESVGSSLPEIGLHLGSLQAGEGSFCGRINGVSSYCVFKQVGSNYIIWAIPDHLLYRRIPAEVAAFALCLILIAMILVSAVTRYMNRYVVDELHKVNEKLYRIAQGNLEETVDVQSSVEFAELGSYINEMVKSLLDNNRKMSYVLNKTKMYIGVYEYNDHMDKVRFTEQIPRIFALDLDQAKQLSSDYKRFQEFLKELKEHPVPDDKGVYQLEGEEEKYIKIEEINKQKETFGVAIDVTEEILKRRKIEEQRDTDMLTGLYNRQGMTIRLAQLFQDPESLGYGALVMVDADGLKRINDAHGHEKGDMYLKRIAEALENLGQKSSIAARLGGDEFVLFLYGYEKEELTHTLKRLEEIQRQKEVSLGDNLQVPLRFSFGYSLIRGEWDYQKLLKEADEKMYVNKRQRRNSERMKLAQ